MGNWQKIFLKGKGRYEEKDAINRSGMEMALGVYPNMQQRQPGGKDGLRGNSDISSGQRA